MGSIPYSGISFSTYETLKKWYSERSNDVPPTSLTRWLFGATAGVLGQCGSYPLDIVRRRFQTAGALSADKAALSEEAARENKVFRTLFAIYKK